jgi:hypothetical protein
MGAGRVMRARLPLLVGVLVAVALAAMWVSQCSGPRPELVGSPAVRPPAQPGQAYRVEATVRNAGPGHGQVQVVVRLRDRATGRSYQRNDTAQLESGEQTSVVVEIFAPPGDYEPNIEVSYPPG